MMRMCCLAPSHPLSRPLGSTREDSTPIPADTVSPTSRLGLEVERDDPLDITAEHAKSLADDHDPFESTRLPSCLGWITPISESPSSNVEIFFPRSASPVEMHALRGATPPPQRQPDHGQPDSYSNTAVSDSESNEGSGQPSSDLGTTARSSSIDPQSSGSMDDEKSSHAQPVQGHYHASFIEPHSRFGALIFLALTDLKTSVMRTERTAPHTQINTLRRRRSNIYIRMFDNRKE
ncbi:hypothetical protein C8J57DRAFT_1514336 [Mycena rebaudengoi]|nr:hypothetical protein C8J57DRAFT_1514336 [Mycena rebaudengoi]